LSAVKLLGYAVEISSDEVYPVRLLFTVSSQYICKKKSTMSNKQLKNLFSETGIIFKTLFFVSFLFVSFIGSAQTYSVGHVQITYTDPARAGRSIQTEIYYPAATAGTSVPVSPGTFPIIVFGHGFVMSWDAYQNIWDDLVPQGYIVAFPRTEGSFSPSHAEFGMDLKFLVTKLQSESATNLSSPFYNHINSKSAIMGHSMGGGSTFLAAESNPNITTMVTFAAANTTPPSIAAATNVSVPALVFAGENDCVAPPAVHQIPMYDSLGSLCKTFISVKGGAHCEFANNNFNCSFGQSTCTPTPAITRAQQQDAVSDLLKLWLEYYLKDICTSWDTFNDSLVASPRITYEQSCLINAPVITQSGAVLTSTPASTYQWYWNGSIIPGATAQNYTTTAPGNYYVMVTYYNTCPYPSNTISVLSTGIISSVDDINVLVFPNPVSSILSIVIENGETGKALITIKNVLGQKLFEKQVDVLINQKQQESISVSEFESGIYFVEITVGNSKVIRKITKN
jgi:dienelactone hydrolase